jgi:hypothetical protein
LGQIPATPERLGLADGGDQRRGVQGTNAGNRGQQPGGLIRSGRMCELLVERQDTAVQLPPFGPLLLDQQPGPRAEGDLVSAQQGLELQLQLTPPLGHDDAALQQEGAQLVDQRRPLAHQPVTGPVQALHVELRLALELDKPHRRPGRRLGDRLRVAVVVLLRLHVGANVLRRHQPDLLALVAQPAAEVMRPTAGLHRHHAARQARRQLDDTLPLQAPSQDHPPAGVQTHHAAAVLTQVDSQNRDLHRTSSRPSGYPASLAQQGRGAGHPIKSISIFAGPLR